MISLPKYATISQVATKHLMSIILPFKIIKKRLTFTSKNSEFTVDKNILNALFFLFINIAGYR